MSKTEVRGTHKSTGLHIPDYTDEQLWEIYSENPSTKTVAKITGYSQSTVRARLARIRYALGLHVKKADPDRAGKLEQLVSSVPLESPGGGKLKELGVKIWGVAAKDDLTQKIIVEGIDSTGATYKFGPHPLDIEPRDSKVVAYKADGIGMPNFERIFIVGDMQIGFWAVIDKNNPKKFNFYPFHDETAVDVMMKAMAAYKPHRVVVVGDLIDYAQLSKFQQEPQWGQTLQASIQEAYDFLKKVRVTVGNQCRIDFIPGNHEKRMTRAIANNNPALYNLTRPGEDWPIYSIPSLMKFDQLNIICAAEYPSGEVWLAKRKGLIPGLVVTHADPRKQDLRADAIHGHIVLPAMEWRQIFYEEGITTYRRMCVSGCGNYSDTADRVRLTRTETPSGRARMAAVKSFGTVDVDRKTGRRTMLLHEIDDGAAMFYGRMIR